MNKVSKVLVIIIGMCLVWSGVTFATIKIYENIKSYYKEDIVNEPISNSEAPVGEIVFKNFNIKSNESKPDFENWECKENIYYKKVTDYSSYKKMMESYSNFRPLNESDFENYFAVVLLSKDVSKTMKYKYITYSEKENMNINIDYIENENNNENVEYTGIIVIMTRWHLDYIIQPIVK